ncbi:hypothetical protein EMIT0P201_11036 [Pseudomonas chlororaphis]
MRQSDPGCRFGGLAPDRSLRQRLQGSTFGEERRNPAIAVAAGAACDRRRSRRKPLTAVRQSDPGCRFGGLAPDRSLRQRLQGSTFGEERRNPAIAVAAGAACDRRRSRRKTADRGVSG